MDLREFLLQIDFSKLNTMSSEELKYVCEENIEPQEVALINEDKVSTIILVSFFS